MGKVSRVSFDRRLYFLRSFLSKVQTSIRCPFQGEEKIKNYTVHDTKNYCFMNVY